MPTQLLNMLQGIYPFGDSIESSQDNRILIKQIFAKPTSHFTEILSKVKLAKRLSQNKIFVKLQTVLQEQQIVCLLYEYVPICMSKYIKAMDEKFLKHYRQKLYQIADILAQNRIITNIDMVNMGLNKQYEAKYFLGMNFVQKKQVNIFQLKNDYLEDIKKIFAPYFSSNAFAISKKVNKNLVKIQNRLSDTQELQNSSTYIYSNHHDLVKTRKHESIYYQKDKDSEIKTRKQSYMSSISNLRLNNLYKRINEIQLQVSNTKSASKNGFKFSIEGRELTSKSPIEKKKNHNQITNSFNNQIFNSSNNSSNNQINNSSNNQIFNSSKNQTLTFSREQPKYYRKQVEFEHQGDYQEQRSQLEDYQKQIRSGKPNNFAVKNQHELAKSHKGHQKKQYKKFSTQLSSMDNFEQPLASLVNTLRISANKLDKPEKRINKKIQMFKERQYSQMKSISANTNYIRDFMSVLQEETSTNERASRNNQNDNQSQEAEANMFRGLQIDSKSSLGQFQFKTQKKNEKTKSNYSCSQISPKSHSQTQLLSSKPSEISFTQSKPLIDINSKKLKTNPNIEQSVNSSNLHNRVKDVIENSKKLIQKLKLKSKKNC